MTSASLFSGCLGADLGLEAAGLEPLWYCEKDRQCQDVIRFHRDVKIYDDVTTLDGYLAPVPDVLWMSPPCQDLSVAGNRAGLSGARSGLFYAAIDVARGLVSRGLRYILMEQVPGLLSSNNGGDLLAVLREFWKLGPVDLGWRILDSRYFGVPQRRRRMYIVLDFGGQRAGEILALSEGLSRNPKTGRATGEGIAASLTAGSHPGSNAAGRRREDDVNLVAEPLTTRPYSDRGSDLALCLTAGMQRLDATVETLVPQLAGTLGASSKGGWGDSLDTNGAFIPQLSHALTANGFDASEEGTGRGTPIVPIAFGWNKSESQTMRVDSGQTDALQASSTSNPAVAFQETESGTREPGHDPVGTRIREGMSVRRLTPTECERLQGFPDDHTRWGKRVDGTVYEMADGPRYRMCGNAVTSSVAKWLGNSVVSL